MRKTFFVSASLLLSRVLRRAKIYCPARSYGLVVLSHATGWLPVFMSKPYPKLRSVILDNDADEANNVYDLLKWTIQIKKT